MRRHLSTGLLAATLALAAGAAQAVTIGFSLTLSGNPNVPTFSLENLSERDRIALFDFTVGDTSRNFDEVILGAGPAGGTSTLVFGSDAQGGTSATGGRTDSFAVAYTGFAPGLTAQLTADVDRDDINSFENYRVRFFNNGAAPNSVATVTFASGRELQITLPDQNAVSNTYFFSEVVDVAPIPLPAGGSLLALALAGIALAARRRRG